jgi:beta-mannosidase
VVNIRLLAPDEQVMAQTNFYFVSPKFLQLEKPSMIITVNETEKTIEVVAETLIKDLYLYAEQGDLRCSDNYFDLLPGERRIIRFQGDIGEGVRFMCLNKP